MTDANSTQPRDRVRFGRIEAAIWRNPSPEGFARYSVSIQRRYRDAEGNWQSTMSFGRDDLLTLAKVADVCHTRISELQAADRAGNSPGDEPEDAPAEQEAA